MLTNPGSYPVRVSYFPHPAFKFVDSSAPHRECAASKGQACEPQVRPERVPELEAMRTHLKHLAQLAEFCLVLLQFCVGFRFVQEAVAELDGNMDNVKHTHQRRTFERYLLYLEASISQHRDVVAPIAMLWRTTTTRPVTTFTIR